MAVKVYRTPTKTMSVTFPDTDSIPELDTDQSYAAVCMAEDRKKLLFSDPGAGKTLTAIQAMLLVEDKLDEDGDAPMLRAIILVPPIAVGTWVRWIGAAYQMVGRDAVVQIIRKGSDKVRVDATHVIITYGTVSAKNIAPVVDDLRRCEHSIFIADESDNLTGLTSNRSVTVFGHGFRRRCDALCHKSQWLWFLTGTPIPRYNDGLYPVLQAVFPEKLHTSNLINRVGTQYETIRNASQFIFVFCTTERVRHGNMKISKERVNGNRNNPLLNKILYSGTFPIAIRIKLNLDVKVIEQEVTIYPTFSKEFLELEEALEVATYVEGDRFVDPRMATLQRLYGEECAPEVAAYVLNCWERDYQRNRAVTLGKIVLYLHKTAGSIIGNTLIRNGLRVRYINGDTDQQEDAETERRFNAGETDIVVGQIVAMGVAINLQERCDHVIFAEEHFSDAKNQQAYQRAYRRGQTRHVRVDRLRALSFVAEMKVNSNAKKRAGASEVLDGKA